MYIYIWSILQKMANSAILAYLGLCSNQIIKIYFCCAMYIHIIFLLQADPGFGLLSKMIKMLEYKTLYIYIYEIPCRVTL